MSIYMRQSKLFGILKIYNTFAGIFRRVEDRYDTFIPSFKHFLIGMGIQDMLGMMFHKSIPVSS